MLLLLLAVLVATAVLLSMLATVLLAVLFAAAVLLAMLLTAMLLNTVLLTTLFATMLLRLLPVRSVRLAVALTLALVLMRRRPAVRRRQGIVSGCFARVAAACSGVGVSKVLLKAHWLANHVHKQRSCCTLTPLLACSLPPNMLAIWPIKAPAMPPDSVGLPDDWLPW